jgi:hypothetical protein
MREDQASGQLRDSLACGACQPRTGDVTTQEEGRVPKTTVFGTHLSSECAPTSWLIYAVLLPELRFCRCGFCSLCLADSATPSSNAGQLINRPAVVTFFLEPLLSLLAAQPLGIRLSVAISASATRATGVARYLIAPVVGFLKDVPGHLSAADPKRYRCR